MKNCIIGQSGGPTAAINASLCGVAVSALKCAEIGKVYGAVNGIQGVFNEKFIDMSEVLKSDADAELLKGTPASFLGSCRYKLPKLEADTQAYEQIFEVFTKYDIGYFFYIGGNDSMDTVDKLSRYAAQTGYDIRIIGVPKTIDNDLMETDHTPGFGSAAKYVATTIREIGLDSDVYDLYSVTIVEVMGRNAGWLTAASVLARGGELAAPHLIYLPESDFEDEKFLQDIRDLNQKGIKNVIVAASEGIRYHDGSYVCEAASSGLTDNFGHKCLSGTAKVLEDMVRVRLGYKARGVEINVGQRCGSHIASLTDINEAFMIGKAAVAEAENGGTGKMMVYVRDSSVPYKIHVESRDIGNIANGEKAVPPSWIVGGNDISEQMIEYALPLIEGEVSLQYKDGLPVYLKR